MLARAGPVNIGGGYVCGSLPGIKHGVFTLGHVPQTHPTTRVDPLFVFRHNLKLIQNHSEEEKKTSSVYASCHVNLTIFWT